MAKEYPEYRDTIAYLTTTFDGKVFVSAAELARHDKCDIRTIYKRYGIPKDYRGLDVPVLAKRMCERARGIKSW